MIKVTVFLALVAIITSAIELKSETELQAFIAEVQLKAIANATVNDIRVAAVKKKAA